MISTDFYICTRKNGWAQTRMISTDFYICTGRIAELKHVWLALISTTCLGSAILPCTYTEIRDNHCGLGSAILPCTYVEIGIIVRVWAQSFFLVHVQKSGLILCVWTQSFFLLYVQKSGIIICDWAQPFFLHFNTLLLIKVENKSFVCIYCTEQLNLKNISYWHYFTTKIMSICPIWNFTLYVTQSLHF
jgi:hypothetical protein